MSTGIVLGVFFSTGDLGDVGRHCVAAALELPRNQVASVKVFSRDISQLEAPNWKCGCSQHCLSEEDRHRIQLIQLDCTKDNIRDALEGVHAVVSCLGSRQPFHPERIVKAGTERLVEAILECRIQRLVMISSVGIDDDWPPMQWSPEGRRMEACFRTICWRQYQDLLAAEAAARRGALRCQTFDFLIVRAVVMAENIEPAGSWHVQVSKEDDHPTTQLSKLDAAKFLIMEAVFPSISRRAVVLGGCRDPSRFGTSAQLRRIHSS